MIKAYKIPQFNAIKIDNEISLRLATGLLDDDQLPPGEPGGGDWDRGSFNAPKVNEFQNDEIWK